MTRIILINPIDRTQIVNRLGVKAPPLNLMYLAAALEKAGFYVKIIDANLYNISPNQIVRIIRGLKPDIIGLTAVTATIKTALRYVSEIKKAISNVFTVIGGPHSTFLPIETLSASKDLDAVVIGEGEETIVEIAESYEKNSPEWLSNVRGVAYRIKDHDSSKIKITPPRPFIKNLDLIPFPARHLTPFNEYKLFNKDTPIGSMITSRGCVFACNYCSSSHLMGRMFRARSPKNVVDEIEELAYKYNVDTIEFIDDIFTLNKKRALKIAEEIRSRKLDIKFVASSRVDTIDRELLIELKKAGLSTMYYGVESGSERVLELMNKRITLSQAEKAINETKSIGVSTLASFILGYPGETIDEMWATIKFSIKLDPDYVQFSILTPYPGTPIYYELKQKGLIATEDWDKYTVLDPVIEYEKLGLSKSIVSKMLREAYLRFYLRPKYLLKRITMLKVLIYTMINTYVLPILQHKNPLGWYRDLNSLHN
ncbi:MAG: radical SAM protein [Thermoprotei archaeon]